MMKTKQPTENKKQPLEFFKTESWPVRLVVLLVDRLTTPRLVIGGLSALATLILVLHGH